MLAARPRVIVPKDVVTGQLCYVPLNITFKVSGVSVLVMLNCI